MSRRGWLLFSAMAVIWGLPYLLIRVAVRQLDPGVLVFARTAPAALLLVPIVAARGQLSLLWRHAWWIVIFGVVEFGVPWYLMSRAEEHITSSLTSLLVCCVPLLSVFAQRVRRTEAAVAPRRFVGLGIGALGVACLVGLDLKGGTLTWIGAMAVVCVGYTIGPLLLATKLREVPGPVVVLGATAFVAVAWLPWDLYHWPSTVSPETWWCVAVLSVVCTATAFVTFYELIKEVGATRSTVVTYVNTAIAVALGIIGLHEPLTVGIAVGCPLVIIGCVVATANGRRGALVAA